MRMSTHEDAAEVWLLRARLRMLAEASELPVPELAVDQPRKEERVAHGRETDGERTVVVPPSLLTADPARQLWYLAACLGRWVSPEPRRRRRLGGLLLALLLVVYVVLLFTVRAPWMWVIVLLLSPVSAWPLRGERGAMDDAGRAILAAAGHPPAAVARAAFGDEPDPTGWKALISGEPAPSRRIRAAQAGGDRST